MLNLYRHQRTLEVYKSENVFCIRRPPKDFGVSLRKPVRLLSCIGGLRKRSRTGFRKKLHWPCFSFARESERENMLGQACIEAYERQYPADRCGIDEWEDRIVIESASGEIAVCEPFGETGETFMDRLERSREEHRNLFYDEWTRCLTMEERVDEEPQHALSPSCIEAYRRQYPQDDIRPAPPGRPAVICWADPRYPDGRFTLTEPPGETNISFFRRLERSRMEGRNLFHEEWILDR